MFKRQYSVVDMLWLLIPIFFAYTRYAHAYIDPGTGSYAIQVAIGLVLGASYVFKTTIGNVVKYIRARFPRKGKNKNV